MGLSLPANGGRRLPPQTRPLVGSAAGVAGPSGGRRGPGPGRGIAVPGASGWRGAEGRATRAALPTRTARACCWLRAGPVVSARTGRDRPEGGCRVESSAQGSSKPGGRCPKNQAAPRGSRARLCALSPFKAASEMARPCEAKGLTLGSQGGRRKDPRRASRLCGSARLLRVEGEMWANLYIFSWRREERAPLRSHQAKQCLHQLLLE